MHNFRDIQKVQEILHLLKQAPLSEMGQIWQTQDQFRHVYDISDIKDDDENRAIVFESRDNFAFSTTHPIYVRINHRDLIFKLTAKNCIIKGNKVICVYPKVAKAIEEREFERFPVPKEKDYYVILKPLGTSAMEIKVRLRDFSKRGLGIIVSEVNRDYISKNVIFHVKSINGLELTGQYEAVYKYTRKIREGVQVGLNLTTEFADPVYQALTKYIISG